jgi:hypothetical protein
MKQSFHGRGRRRDNAYTITPAQGVRCKIGHNTEYFGQCGFQVVVAATHAEAATTSSTLPNIKLSSRLCRASSRARTVCDTNSGGNFGVGNESEDLRVDAMKARKLIEGASYDPAQVKALGEAFDAAWKHVAPGVRDNPAAHEAARMSWQTSFSSWLITASCWTLIT